MSDHAYSMSIHSKDDIKLAGEMRVKELHVNLGWPGPVVDVQDFDLKYDQIKFYGVGQFRMLRHGKQMWRIEQCQQNE